ncbi:MAG: L-rhamnose isomerase, partial [Clostridia bacterium]|nr:L-rhamnose isomerase [Clostridia bacterium]
MNEMYLLAKQEYEKIGIDTEKAIEKLSEIPVSVHCWQGDDVVGLDGGGAASGGIQTTGNYPGRAKNSAHLTDDIIFAFSLMPGKTRLNIHARYAVLGDDLGKIDRDAYEPKHFAPWVKFAKENGISGIDFNPTMFSHKMVKDGLTLSSPDEKVRKFWIDHCIACIRIS